MLRPFVTAVILGQCFVAYGCMQVRPRNVAVLQRTPQAVFAGATEGGAVRGTATQAANAPNVRATEVANPGIIFRSESPGGSTATETSVISKPVDSVTQNLTESIEHKRPEGQACVQPSQTSSLFVSDTVDQHNDISFGPLGGPDSAPYEKRCKCDGGTMYYYRSVSTTSWFDILAKAQQAVDLTCDASHPICVCEAAGICYTATNATVHAVLASYCVEEDICDLYMLVEGDTDDEGMVPIDGGPIIRSGDQYAPDSTTPFAINSPSYDYKKISAIACGQCPISRTDCFMV